jgi:PTH1 family peptidyl-tRNA hydrolase
VKLIVGLGNPGRSYEGTRHNVGWWVVDHLAGLWRFDGWRRDHDAVVADGQVAAQRVRLLKPQTYMNLSGAALRPYLRRAAWSPATDLLVIVDEVALPIGRFRLRAEGSAGGHNGLKSVEAAVGSRAYARLRVGVGPPADRERKGTMTDYVLGRLGKEEKATITALLPTLEEVVATWLQSGAATAMARYNRRGTGDGRREAAHPNRHDEEDRGETR